MKMSDKQQTPARAIVLVSGGLDSATVLAIAQSRGFDCYALSFDYGQRHRAELDAAARISAAMGAVAHRVVRVDLGSLGGSALTDTSIAVPEHQSLDVPVQGIPVTYVPARNTVFLSYALAYAEVVSAQTIFIGVNAVDYSGYPDCRPEYIAAFETMANLATKAGVEGSRLSIEVPLIALSKGEIIAAGLALGVDYAATVSCYQANDAGEACGSCDSCHLRKQGFVDAGVPDPTHYFPRKDR